MWNMRLNYICRASSQEYLDWLYDYVVANGHADDESAAYVYEGIDSENGQILWAFCEYVRNLAKEQGIWVYYDPNLSFENYEVIVKIKDRFFSSFEMWGIGSWASVKLLDNEPDAEYVTL